MPSERPCFRIWLRINGDGLHGGSYDESNENDTKLVGDLGSLSYQSGSECGGSLELLVDERC